ncbi:DNA-binding response OmpR family regulator [Pedobacter africanus]|uniref:DNA-binding response OmpR family regulator n=1 Tax=Pedobacter africanus TaxID=151894 RepID=A0ACC6KVT1_9SPHI|nr:response regulator transcription factor [Pedobacter africanus]MDR6783262.1 DNA-binding response OmpR family regulator [Pedobacter africanus]
MNNENRHILLVEDELNLAGIIKDVLENQGFKVSSVADGNEAYFNYLAVKPDLLILDVMLPGESGLAVAKKIRIEDDSTPIIFLTARSMPQDVLNGFESGGNDYLKKPFDMDELLVRIRVLLTRNRLLEQHGILNGVVEIGEYQYDVKRSILLHQGLSRQLSAREGEVLKVLYQSRNRLLTRKDLLVQVWGDDDFFSSRSLDVYISRLRRYLKPDPLVQIINHRGFGYKLIC